jgi:hypothetical protein
MTTITNVVKITLYIDECYGCEKANRFGPLRQLIISRGLPLSVLDVRRIDYDRKWQSEAAALGVGLPAVVIESKGGKLETMPYAEFVSRSAGPRKRKAAKVSIAPERAPAGEEAKNGREEQTE